MKKIISVFFPFVEKAKQRLPRSPKNIFILFLLGCILLSTFHVNAQTSLKGKITDKETKEAIPGAVISFPDLQKPPVSSKLDGTYEIKELPKIKTMMLVKMTGYKTYVAKIDLAVVSVLNIEMDTSVIEADEVIVTGTSHATELLKNPVPMYIISPEYLLQNAATNIIDAMIKIPGVSAVSTGPNVSKPFIRGLGYNRILTLFDGVRQDGQQWGDEHGIEVDQYLVERIEVVKGPASLIYGSDALAGVINLLPAHSAPEGMIKGAVFNNYQTNNLQIGNSISLNGNDNGFTWGFTASHKQASDYKNKYDGRVFGTKYNENDLNFKVGINRSWGFSHLNFSLYDNQQEIPDGSRDSVTRKFTKQITEEDTIRPIVNDDELSSYKIAVIHQRVQHYRVYSANSFIIGKSRLGIKIGFQKSVRREFGHPQHPELPALQLQLYSATYDVKYYLPEVKGWETTVGVNGMYQKNSNKNATEFVIPNYSSFDAGPFAFTKRSFKKLEIAFGFRYDIRTFKNDALFTKTNPETGFDMETNANSSDSTVIKQFDFYEHTFSGFSGSAGFTYNLTRKFFMKMNV
ncbi:MAG: TonB-dependent receptor plug domain-containing protein, partial [Bacteroidia bacterium]|nr:TonB-dependent receptor plug domain-containing protein [Bacteroidia bacterium]